MLYGIIGILILVIIILGIKLGHKTIIDNQQLSLKENSFYNKIYEETNYIFIFNGINKRIS